MPSRDRIGGTQPRRVVALGGVGGEDAHSVGLTILRHALTASGLDVLYVGLYRAHSRRFSRSSASATLSSYRASTGTLSITCSALGISANAIRIRVGDRPGISAGSSALRTRSAVCANSANSGLRGSFPHSRLSARCWLTWKLISKRPPLSMWYDMTSEPRGRAQLRIPMQCPTTAWLTRSLTEPGARYLRSGPLALRRPTSNRTPSVCRGDH